MWLARSFRIAFDCDDGQGIRILSSSGRLLHVEPDVYPDSPKRGHRWKIPSWATRLVTTWSTTLTMCNDHGENNDVPSDVGGGKDGASDAVNDEK